MDLYNGYSLALEDLRIGAICFLGAKMLYWALNRAGVGRQETRNRINGYAAKISFRSLVTLILVWEIYSVMNGRSDTGREYVIGHTVLDVSVRGSFAFAGVHIRMPGLRKALTSRKGGSWDPDSQLPIFHPVPSSPTVIGPKPSDVYNARPPEPPVLRREYEIDDETFEWLEQRLIEKKIRDRVGVNISVY